jgi:hypothetical protein
VSKQHPKQQEETLSQLPALAENQLIGQVKPIKVLNGGKG